MPWWRVIPKSWMFQVHDGYGIQAIGASVYVVTFHPSSTDVLDPPWSQISSSHIDFPLGINSPENPSGINVRCYTIVTHFDPQANSKITAVGFWIDKWLERPIVEILSKHDAGRLYEFRVSDAVSVRD
ncbi:hypothetical protein BJ742DRAFT_779011 [Cladochytrium replicatum]|nr:hypothetical protein BJ742DRAFT_779011 [Cladochytrium replicatum]